MACRTANRGWIAILTASTPLAKQTSPQENHLTQAAQVQTNEPAQTQVLNNSLCN